MKKIITEEDFKRMFCSLDTFLQYLEHSPIVRIGAEGDNGLTLTLGLSEEKTKTFDLYSLILDEYIDDQDKEEARDLNERLLASLESVTAAFEARYLADDNPEWRIRRSKCQK